MSYNLSYHSVKKFNRGCSHFKGLKERVNIVYPFKNLFQDFYPKLPKAKNEFILYVWTALIIFHPEMLMR